MIAVGQKFGLLTAVQPAVSRGGKTWWLFSCECGVKKELRVSAVKYGTPKSCGCAIATRNRERPGHLSHGDARKGKVVRLHGIWRKMLGRCNSTVAVPHAAYAGRGVAVCPEWTEYVAFKAWALENGYQPHLTIERIDNDGNYEPSNCRWATRRDQTRNRRSSRFIEHAGRRLLLCDWATATGLDASLIAWRIKQGWPMDRVLGQGAK